MRAVYSDACKSPCLLFVCFFVCILCGWHNVEIQKRTNWFSGVIFSFQPFSSASFMRWNVILQHDLSGPATKTKSADHSFIIVYLLPWTERFTPPPPPPPHLPHHQCAHALCCPIKSRFFLAFCVLVTLLVSSTYPEPPLPPSPPPPHHTHTHTHTHAHTNTHSSSPIFGCRIVHSHARPDGSTRTGGPHPYAQTKWRNLLDDFPWVPCPCVRGLVHAVDFADRPENS